MQFSKFKPLLCAAAFCAGLISARADDTPVQAAARAALNQKMNELDAEQAATNTQAAVATTPTIPAPAEVQSALATTPAVTDAQPAARAALDQKMHEMDVQQAPTNAAAPAAIPAVQSPVATNPAPATVNYPGQELGFKPFDVPPPPVSADKLAQLQALLAKYMADQISPDEYQKQRAAILAQP